MEHFKSTLATAAIAAFGLVTAAHVLHPGNFERTTYPSRPVAAVAPQASAPQVSAWVNPPASLPVAAPVEAPKPVAETVAPLPVAWTSATVPPVEASPAPASRRKVSAAHRHRVAQKQACLRQAELARPAAETAPTPAAAKAQANRIDPIGDIIRGLGLGSDS
ncbi:MAG: hypothetical protein INR70_39610 [Parafilimonas terrae]|nr:hypothetical protein [Parafilimonas terrae]